MKCIDASGLIEEVEEDGREDVVGKIADNSERLSGGQPAEIKLQGIRVVNLKIPQAGTKFLQGPDKITIQLHHLKLTCGL